MTKKKDWLKRPLAELNVMFTNVNGKIDGYQIAYNLNDDWVDRIKLICQTFNTAYTNVVQNRATENEMNKWFDALLNGEPKGSPATAAPTFKPITLPAGAFIGLLDEFREMIRFFKANAAYNLADGENLMIVPPDEGSRNIAEAAPELKVSIDVNGDVSIEYLKEEFSGLELQWRKTGQQMWQFADKSTEKVITFTPSGITSPEKIEVRGVYLWKNNRVGNWSPVYTLTVG